MAYVDQTTRRQSSLVSPVVFDVLIGATSTAIYTGIADASFLIRKLAVIDDTVGAVTLTITVDGNQWYTASIASDAFTQLTAFEGMLIDPSIDIAATGENLRIVGWGIRVGGGDTWVL